jgi:NH3-dependent NAD+ synthetase
VSELGDVEFDDGVTVTDPDQDALGYVYETHDDYLHGKDPSELEPDHDGADDAHEDHVDDLGDEDL